MLAARTNHTHSSDDEYDSSSSSSSGERHFELAVPVGLSSELKRQRTTEPPVASPVGLPTSTGAIFMNSSAPTPPAQAVFSALPTGAATHQDAVQKLETLVGKIGDPHREDGYSETEDSFFGENWLSVQHHRQQLLMKDPEYSFLQLVAGASGREPEALYDKEALDQYAKRSLQQAATLDEIRKELLKDVDTSQKMIETLRKTQSENSELLIEGNVIARNLKSIAEVWNRDVDGALTKVKAQLEETAKSVAGWSFDARCRYPLDGADSALFGDDVLQLLWLEGVNESRLEKYEALVTNLPTGVASKKTFLTSKAKDNNPKNMTMAAVMSFVYALTKTRNNLHYVVQRNFSAVPAVFPSTGMYASKPDQFENDIVALFELFNTDNAKRHVTWDKITVQTYVHLVCMYERWYGSHPEDSDKPVNAGGGDVYCVKRPILRKPTKPRTEQARPFRTRRSSFVGEEEEDFDEIMVDGTDVRKEERKTKDPEEFQTFLLIMFQPLFRHGMATLAWDVGKLRRYVCDSDTRVRDVLACERNSDDLANALVLVQPSTSVEQTLVRLDYFFGGISLEKIDVRPTLVNTSKSDMSLLDQFLTATYQLYVFSLIDEKSQDVIDSYKNLSTTQIPFADGIGSENWKKIIGPQEETKKSHESLRTRAVYQLSGGMSLFVSYIRQVRHARQFASAVSYAALATASTSNLLNSDILRLTLLDEEEAVLVSDDQKSTTTNLYRRAVRNALDTLVSIASPYSVSAKATELAPLVERVLQDATKTVSDRAASIRGIEDGFVKRMEELINANSPAEATANVRETMAADRIRRLKRLLAATYVPSAQWASKAQNSGYLIVSAAYTTAVNMAYECVQENAPNIANATLLDLKISPMTKTVFAELVAHMLARTESRNPRTLTLNRFPDDVLRAGRSLMMRIRKLPPLTQVGLGVERNGGSGLRNKYENYPSSEADRGYASLFAPRNRWVMAETREARDKYVVNMIPQQAASTPTIPGTTPAPPASPPQR